MRPFEVAAPGPWIDVDPSTVFPGRCNEKATAFVLANPERHTELTLVHGTVIGEAGRMGHAWIEVTGGLIFDGTLQRFYCADGYARHHRSRVGQRYSPAEVIKLVIAFGHYGPWNQAERVSLS